MEAAKILVVDDDQLVTEMLAEILASGGYKVDTVDNGMDAISKFQAGSDIEVIISDMNMPEMDGNALIREIRKSDENIPIIILTGNNKISVAIEAIRNGANDYLLKDENIQDTLILSVEKMLDKYRLKKQNLQLLEDLARKNSELIQLNEKLVELSSTDPLTSIYNRRKLFELLDIEIEKSKRYGRPLSLLILDLDHFKKVNDTFGHDVGDEVLKTAANVIGGIKRKGDIFARYGGEEFVLVSPETTLAGVAALAEKIRSHIEQTPFPKVGLVTVSIGAAEFHGNEADSLLKKADEALYDAKRKGRNRVELSAAR